MLKQMKLSIGELRYLSLKCSRCQAEITLDLQSDAAPQNKNRPAGNLTPFDCPACDTRFDSKVQEGIDHFRTSYRSLSNAALTGTEISFTVTSTE